MDKPVLGQLVSSTAGRDQGKYYLVVEISSDSFVYVADGTTREITAPKKKNLKHLIIHPGVADALARSIASGQGASSAAVRSALSALLGAPGQVPAQDEEVDLPDG